MVHFFLSSGDYTWTGIKVESITTTRNKESRVSRIKGDGESVLLLKGGTEFIATRKTRHTKKLMCPSR